MSNAVPSCLPLTPQQVQLGFDYVLAVDAGDDVTAARLAIEIHPYPGLLAAVAEKIVFPVTALSDDTDDLNADSFVLDELGVIFLMAIREWNHLCPATAPPAIARCIVHFTSQALVDGPRNVTRTLEAMRDEHMALAASFEALPGASADQ